MSVETVRFDEIDDTERLRPINPAWAEVMRANYEAGEPVPMILVRPAGPPEIAEGCRYQLVFGGHRLAGARLAGLSEMPIEVREMTRFEAIILEGKENLDRYEPTYLDRIMFISAWKQAYEKAKPTARHGGDRKSIRWAECPLAPRFSQDVAGEIGRDERTIRRYLAIAEGLSPAAIGFLRACHIADNASELRRLAEAPANDQIAIAESIAKGEARTVEQARVTLGMAAAIETDPDEQLYNRLVEMWSRASTKVKRRFEQHAALVYRASREGSR